MLFELLFFLPDAQYLEDSEDTDHDESVFVSMMIAHETADVSTELRYEYEEEEDWYHEGFPVSFCPFSECWIICLEVFCLEECEPSDDNDEDECEETAFRHSHDTFRCHFSESFLKHLECGKEDDEESEPLYRWIFVEEFCDESRCDDHEDDWYDKSDCEIDDVSVTCPGNGENIVEWHGNIGDDDHLYCCSEIAGLTGMFVIVVFACANLAVEFPDDIEEKYGSEEFESRDLKEDDDSHREDDSECCSSGNSPENCFFSLFGWEIFRCHTYEDCIVPAHNEIDHDDVEEGKPGCRRGCRIDKCVDLLSENIRREHMEEFVHGKNEKLKWGNYIFSPENCKIFDEMGDIVLHWGK